MTGKAYKILFKVSEIPSRKCIINMLEKIPFLIGIIKIIFYNLNNAVKKIC